MGRDRKNEEKIEHWTKMVRPVMETDAWRALSPVAQALYVWLKFEWHGPKANNNGKLMLSVRQAAQCIGCNRKTAGKGFHDLQAKGFIVQTHAPTLGTAGAAKTASYEITELSLPQSHTGRRLYQDWQNGHDFPVKIAPTNNPNGRNQKLEAQPENRLSLVHLAGRKA